jgi:hypothetical protein
MMWGVGQFVAGTRVRVGVVVGVRFGVGVVVGVRVTVMVK